MCLWICVWFVLCASVFEYCVCCKKLLKLGKEDISNHIFEVQYELIYVLLGRRQFQLLGTPRSLYTRTHTHVLYAL